MYIRVQQCRARAVRGVKVVGGGGELLGEKKPNNLNENGKKKKRN